MINFREQGRGTYPHGGSARHWAVSQMILLCLTGRSLGSSCLSGGHCMTSVCCCDFSLPTRLLHVDTMAVRNKERFHCCSNTKGILQLPSVCSRKNSHTELGSSMRQIIAISTSSYSISSQRKVFSRDGLSYVQQV